MTVDMLRPANPSLKRTSRMRGFAPAAGRRLACCVRRRTVPTRSNRHRSVGRHRTEPPRSAYGTVNYEIRALSDAHDLYVLARCRGGVNSAIQNVSLEAFLLHVRVLRDFFLGEGGGDDIKAERFLGSQMRFRLPIVRRLRVRLNKALAHPSYRRPRYRKPWPVSEIHSELRAAWSAFLRRLARENAGAYRIFSRRYHHQP